MNFKQFYKKAFVIIKKTEGHCAYCGSADADQIDHIIPKFKNGGNENSNLICSCKKCNVIKSHFTLEEFRDKLFRHLNKIPRFTKDQKTWLLSKGFKMPKNDLVFYFEEHGINISGVDE